MSKKGLLAIGAVLVGGAAVVASKLLKKDEYIEAEGCDLIEGDVVEDVEVAEEAAE